MYSLSDISSRIGLRLNVFLQAQGRTTVWIQQYSAYLRPRSSLISTPADGERKERLPRNFLTSFPLASLLVCLRF